jgi:hypothetical protein
MDDSELKKLLVETCPIRPGQEGRAWSALRERLYQTRPSSSLRNWLFYPTWRGAAGVFAVVCALVALGNAGISFLQPVSFASANSEVPGVYATSFYSHSAKAQVVWLNGLGSASDQPTYLDPTTPVPRLSKSPPPSGDPGSL